MPVFLFEPKAKLWLRKVLPTLGEERSRLWLISLPCTYPYLEPI
jgi:hypothetical protein